MELRLQRAIIPMSAETWGKKRKIGKKKSKKEEITNSVGQRARRLAQEHISLIPNSTSLRNQVKIT